MECFTITSPNVISVILFLWVGETGVEGMGRGGEGWGGQERGEIGRRGEEREREMERELPKSLTSLAEQNKCT